MGVARRRVRELFEGSVAEHYRRGDQLFARLLAVQWAAGIGVALLMERLHPPAARFLGLPLPWLAALAGALLIVPPLLLARMRPGWWLTRHAVAFAQVSWSALLIHLCGGRAEAHFHEFGSLAFLAYYRDWRVLLTGSTVLVLDHAWRGLWWPGSVYGMSGAEWWRTIEHAFWMVFEDFVLFMGIRENRRETLKLVAHQIELERLNQSIELKVEARASELAAINEQLRALVETTHTIPWQMAMPGERFTYVGPQAGEMLSCPADAWTTFGFLNERVHPHDLPALRQRLRAAFTTRAHGEAEYRLRRDDGEWMWVRCSIAWGETPAGACLRGFLQDVTERRHLETELQQSQKLESVGRLAAGIAHEINTPIQYVGDSVHFIRDGITSLLTLVRRVREIRDAAGDTLPAASAADLAAAEEEADVSYLEERLPKAIDRSLDGLDRVARIVRAMKEFAHPDQTDQAPADLNRALEATLTIATNEYKYVATLETAFAAIPPVTCHINEINQVVLNIVVNAAHAIGDVVKGTSEKGSIRVATRQEDAYVVVEISDTGGGIPEAIQSKVFDPFFTTKEVGKGTGQGLSIARSVVVDKHGGTILFHTTPGKGTTFVLRLPIAGRPKVEAKAA